MSYMRDVRATRSFKLNFLNQPSSANSDYWTEDDFTYGRFPVARTYLSVDGAVTTKTKSDYTGLAVVGCAPARPARDGNRAVPARCLVEHAEAVKLKGRALRDRVLQLLDSYPEIGAILVEANQGGDLWHEVFHNLPVRVVTFSNSEAKEVRAARVLNLYQLLPARVVHAEAIPVLEEQMCAFPNGLNDDLVDAVGNPVLRFLRPPAKKAPPSATSSSYM
jgi:phage terminase large subunit-like protein